jgi:uncharacterized protein
MLMKYLLTIGLVVFAMWLWLRGRRKVAAPAQAAPQQAAQEKLQTMVVCAHCGVHLPRGDALIGQGDHAYCSTAHRQLGPR